MNEFNTILVTNGNGANYIELRTNREHNLFNVIASADGDVKHDDVYTSQTFAIMMFTAYAKSLGLNAE